MSPVAIEFKKRLCRPVEFKGQAPKLYIVCVDLRICALYCTLRVSKLAGSNAMSVCLKALVYYMERGIKELVTQTRPCCITLKKIKTM